MSINGLSRRSLLAGTSLGAAALIGLRGSTPRRVFAARQDDLEPVSLQLN